MFPDLLKPHRQTLSEAVSSRFSCHTFSASPTLQDWAVLSYLAGRWEHSGTRLRLTRVPSGFFSGGILRFGKITGTDTVCVLSGPDDEMHVTAAGFLGEAFILDCTSRSFATCWLTGSLLRKPLPVPISPGETVFALIALGHPGESPTPRRRKDLSRLCEGDVSTWPSPFRQAAQYVWEAPSASNAQPFLMSVSAHSFSIDSSDKTRLDLGVAICHASLALDMPFRWVAGTDRSEPMATCLCSQ